MYVRITISSIQVHFDEGLLIGSLEHTVDLWTISFYSTQNGRDVLH